MQRNALICMHLIIYYIRDTMDFTEEQVKEIEHIFRKNLPPNKESLTLPEFKKLMPSNNVSFNIYHALPRQRLTNSWPYFI